MADITTTHALDIIVHDTGRHTIRRAAVMSSPVRDLDIIFLIHDRTWGEFGKFGPICAKARSQDEAEHWIEGVESGQFVPIPLPEEFSYYPGLEERVKGGA